MNHFSYEYMGKDRISSLQQEGMKSQASQSSGLRKTSMFRLSSKLIVVSTVVLGILILVWH